MAYEPGGWRVPGPLRPVTVLPAAFHDHGFHRAFFECPFVHRTAWSLRWTKPYTKARSCFRLLHQVKNVGHVVFLDLVRAPMPRLDL